MWMKIWSKINYDIRSNKMYKKNDKFGIIYCAYNKINGKRYVGQTKDPLKKRISGHYSSPNCIYFHRALLKYQMDDWDWKIIDYADNQEELDAKESFWIRFFDLRNPKLGYNLTDGGQGSSGVIITEEHKRRTRESMLKAVGNNYSSPKQSPYCPVKCIETNEIFTSYSAAARAYNVGMAYIRTAALNPERTVKGLHWEKLTGVEKLKGCPYAIYCVELNKAYENIRQARVEDRFHEGNLSKALKIGNPYEEKHYAGYTFLWINPEYNKKI